MKSAVLAFCAAMSTTAYAAGPVVLIVGPPGSGRTTQAELLSKTLGAPLISADELISRNPQKFQKNRIPTLNGVDVHLDPALNQLVESALLSTDLSKGVVLDGYPASKIQGDFLMTLREKFELPAAIVIHLNAPDDVVRKRLKKQNRPDIDQELKDYHREFAFVRQYFPDADIRTIDATRKPAEVAKQIRKLLQNQQN
jgi:adenylate kinase